MTVLHFHNATLIDPLADDPRPGSMVVDNGVIVALDVTSTPRGATAIDCQGKMLAPGLVDMGVKIGEPGERHKESFRSAGRAAAAGGVTTIVMRPDTSPAVDTPEGLEFVLRRAAEATPVRVHPMAALTKGRAGAEMTEIGFLLDAGAVAFTDCDAVVRDAKILARCMTYARSNRALVIGHPQDPTLSAGAAASAGKFASLYGLPHVSPLAERMGLERDLALVEMTNVAYHADALSAAVSLPVLERAKRARLNVTAGVNIHHLTLNDLDIGDYRTFFKFKPPLRAEEDRQAMIEAVARGLIDIIGSFHTPQDEESKRLPFEAAASGAVGLETLLPAALRLYHGGHLGLTTLWRAMSLTPARRLGLPTGRLDEGAPADLILFDPNAPFVLDRFALQSKSKNTPFDGARLEGRVLGTWVAGRQVWPEGAAP